MASNPVGSIRPRSITEDGLSGLPDGYYSSDIDPPEAADVTSIEPVNTPVSRGRTTGGSLFLYLAVIFVVSISVGALIGKVDPVAGAVIVLGSEVLGTIAFFLTYYIGRRRVEAPFRP